MIGKSELSRTYRVLDQSISIYAALRDRFERRALLSDILRFAGSTILVALMFFDPTLTAAWLEPGLARSAMRALSLVLFVFSVAKFRLKWEERCAEYARAVRELSRLKAQGRELLAEDDRGAGAHEDGTIWVQQVSEASSSLPPIPERVFLSLKARHLRKVALSRMVDRNPFVPLWWARLKLWRRYESTNAVPAERK